MKAPLLVAALFVAQLTGCGSTSRATNAGPSDVELPSSCSPEAAPGGAFALDDFEDGDARLDGQANLHGFWYVNNDGTGTQVPALNEQGATPALLSDEGAPGSTSHALYTSGNGFERWGAFVAARLNSARSRACTYDVSASSGIRLAVKGSGSLRVNLGTVATTPIVDGGSCTAELCSDHGLAVALEPDWRSLRISFDELSQPSWASAAAWDPASLLRVSFWSEQADFEFWIDDVGFY